MIVFLLGLLDILAALSIFTLQFSWGAPLVIFSVIYLVIKSLPYLKSFASIIDLLVACIFLFAVFGYAVPLLNVLGSLWLIQKGVISFF